MPPENIQNETDNWKIFVFYREDLENATGITDEARNEIKLQIAQQKIKSFEIKYPPGWTAATWPLHGFLVPEGVFIDEGEFTIPANGCNLQVSFHGNTEKEKYYYPVIKSGPARCGAIFDQILSTFRLLE